MEDLADHNRFGTDLEVADLSFEEQEAIRLLLLARAMDTRDDRAFWRGEFGIHEMDATNATLTLQGDILMVTRKVPNGHAGFGSNVRTEIQ